MTTSDRWLTALERRHLSNLTFQEVSRALRALSSTYVERRDKLRQGAALSGEGKRAAFALFYGPLHYLLVREIVAALETGSTAERVPSTLIDLGCGTGAAGAAWAEFTKPHPTVIGVDTHPWVLGEAAHTYREFGLAGRTVRAGVSEFVFPKPRAMILAAFVVNELDDARRERLKPRLIERAAAGDRVLIVEPLARGVARWWREWEESVVRAGGRADEWRFRVELPPIVAKLDRAAGLNHRELTARSLFL